MCVRVRYWSGGFVPTQEFLYSADYRTDLPCTLYLIIFYFILKSGGHVWQKISLCVWLETEVGCESWWWLLLGKPVVKVITGGGAATSKLRTRMASSTCPILCASFNQDHRSFHFPLSLYYYFYFYFNLITQSNPIVFLRIQPQRRRWWYLLFPPDCSCFAVGTKDGFRIFDTNTGRLCYERG